MQLTHLGHSAVLVETAGLRILIDPGNFSDAWQPAQQSQRFHSKSHIQGEWLQRQ